MVSSYINQQKKLCDLHIQEAYMTCSLIDAQEEHLLLNHFLLLKLLHLCLLNPSHFYIDDFEEQLIGHKVGEEVDVLVTFPEDYGKEDLNGKEALYFARERKAFEDEEEERI